MIRLINVKSWMLAMVVLQSVSMFAQQRFDPSPEEIERAKTIKEEICSKDDDVALLKSKTSIRFGYTGYNKKVNVDLKRTESYIAVEKNAKMWLVESYDENSRIDLFDVYNKKKREANARVYDRFYESEDLFYHDMRLKSSHLTFPLLGYFYEWKMNKHYKDIKYFTSLYFTSKYPTKEKTIEIEVPKWLNIEFKEMNFDGYAIEKTVDESSSNYTKYSYTIKDVKGVKQEGAMPGPSYFMPHLLVLPKSHIKLNQETSIFKETGDLYNWYKSLVDLLEEKPEELKALVEKLTADKPTDEDKIKAIYYWVQDHIRYIAYEDGIAGFKPDESQNVYSKKYGDCKGMANLMTEMLKIAGFDAHLTWIGTNRIAYDYSTPNLSVDNHMICTLNHKGKRYFLDGTQKYNALGANANRIQGRQVLIENGTDYILDRVPLAKSDVNKEIMNISYTIEDDALIGKVVNELNGESKSQFIYGYNNIESDSKDDVLKKYLSKNDKNISISNINTSDLKDREGKTNLEYDIKINNRVSSYDGEIYVDIDYFQEFGGLDLKERENDYFMSYKYYFDSSISVKIPEGYKIDHQPKDISIEIDDFTITLKYHLDGNKFICEKLFNFKSGKIFKKDFEKYKVFHSKLKDNYNDQLTLIKI